MNRSIATDEHPFLTVERGWVSAADLRRGEHLLDADGTPVAVDAVLDLDRVTWVYNLTVEGLHTYYVGADPVLVHNAGKKRDDDCGGAPAAAAPLRNEASIVPTRHG